MGRPQQNEHVDCIYFVWVTLSWSSDISFSRLDKSRPLTQKVQVVCIVGHEVSTTRRACWFQLLRMGRSRRHNTDIVLWAEHRTPVGLQTLRSYLLCPGRLFRHSGLGSLECIDCVRLCPSWLECIASEWVIGEPGGNGGGGGETDGGRGGWERGYFADELENCEIIIIYSLNYCTWYCWCWYRPVDLPGYSWLGYSTGMVHEWWNKIFLKWNSIKCIKQMK